MLIFNLLGYNLTWFGLVYWGNDFIPCALTFLTLHFYLNKSVASKELMLVGLVSAIGISVDSLLHYTGVFIFPEQTHIPFWLLTLWLCFATTISQSLSLLSYSKFFQGVVGFFLAPLSYLFGQQLNAVEFGMSLTETYILLSVLWCFLMLCFFYIKARINHDGVIDYV